MRGIAGRRLPAHLAASGRVAMACTRTRSSGRLSPDECVRGIPIAPSAARPTSWAARMRSRTAPLVGTIGVVQTSPMRSYGLGPLGDECNRRARPRSDACCERRRIGERARCSRETGTQQE